MEIVLERKLDWRGDALDYRVEKHHPYIWKAFLAGELCATGVSKKEVTIATRACMNRNPLHYIRAQEKLDAKD